MREVTEKGIQKAKELEKGLEKELGKGVNFLKEFKKFASRGNVIDLAIGVIIGAAFGKIVTSLVTDLVMPSIGLVLGKVDLAKLFIALDHKVYPTLEAAKAAKAPVLAYGNFLQTIVDFVLVAFVIFIAVRQINRFTKPQGPPATPTTKECPQCLSNIPIKATRCAYCTQTLA
jgi:large conductance mechanosensitive channel